ncbi:hypothetical protein [Streptomyces sp. NPDC005423]|uniref:hypothetical protein n=1 Tax=Streptomyces sp. NPDC005423 TaxID=3155343 RepID=UPI0033ACEC21
MYDQTSKSYYAVTPDNPSATQVARWDGVKDWVYQNRSKLTKALVEMVPTLVQGAAGLMSEGKAKTITTAVGVGTQGIAVGHEVYHAYKNNRAGEPVDGYAATATASRVAAFGNNLASALLPTGSVSATVTNNVGTYSNALATGINLVHDPQAGRGGPMYMHTDATLGYEMGNIRPGYYQTPTSQSSNSSGPNVNYSQYPQYSQPSASTSGYQAGDYTYQPTHDPAQYRQHGSDPGASSSNDVHYQAHQGQPHGR